MSNDVVKSSAIEEANELVEESEAELQENLNRFNSMLSDTTNPWGYSTKGKAAKSAAMSMLSTKNGLYARIPITCKAEMCPYANTCSLLEFDIAPYGEKCPNETSLIEQALEGYRNDFSLDENASFTDLTIVKNIVNCDIMMERAQALLANEGQAIDQVYAGSNEKSGEDFYNKEISKALDLYERHEKQRSRLLDMMLATRKAKAQAKQDTGNNLSEILAQAMETDFIIEDKPDDID